MDHRVKNTFSLAIRVLSLSGRSAQTAHGVVETASARLTALARAHELTLSHSHADVVDGGEADDVAFTDPGDHRPSPRAGNVRPFLHYGE